MACSTNAACLNDAFRESIEVPKSTVHNKLTAKKVENARLAPGKTEEILNDGGNLELRLRQTTSGVSKTWQFKFRFDGQREKIYIGKYPEISLEAVREIARKYRETLATKENPKDHLEHDAAVEHANKLAEVNGAPPDTFGELFERWRKEYLVFNRPASEGTTRRQFEMHILPNGMAEVKLSLLRVSHIVKVLNGIRAAGYTRTCGVALDGIRQMVKWAKTMEWMQNDPTFGLKKSEWKGDAREVERALTESEIVQLHWRLKKSSMVTRWKHLIWLILATGTRIEESVLTERPEVNMQKSTWSIPPEHQKVVNTNVKLVTHVVHLSGFAKKHMQALMEMPGTEHHVIPARVRKGSRSGPADCKSLTKMLNNLQGGTQKGRRNTVEFILEEGTWTPHDLRRTMSTLMQELGIHPDVIDKCQNHALSNKTRRIYQRAEMRRFMTDAWDRLGDKLEELTQMPDPEPDYVAPKPKAAFFDNTNLEAVARRDKELKIAEALNAAHAAAARLGKSTKKSKQAKKQLEDVANFDFGDSHFI